MTIERLTCEFRAEPIGIDADRPLLQWQLKSRGYGIEQDAYQVVVASAPCLLDAPDLWDSRRVESAEDRTEYAGQPLASDQRAYWRVTVWSGNECVTSDMATWRHGVRSPDWHGKWIGLDEGRDSFQPDKPYYCADDYERGENHPFLPKPVMLLGKFSCDMAVSEATLYVSAMGLTKVFLNGQPVSEDFLAPGHSDYSKRVYYRAYDVTKFICNGKNALSAVLADGWYAGYIGLNPRQWWGAKPRLSMQLMLHGEGGTQRMILSDESWRAATGPWLYADIMHGAGYDATLERDGWQLPNYDVQGWQHVATGAEYEHIPCAHPGLPIVCRQRHPATHMTRYNDGTVLVDFGCCFAGIVRVTLRGKRGARIELQHAEELTRDRAHLYLRGNRSAQAHDIYILRGSGEETFQPEFTYHGFRYVLVSGLLDTELIAIEGLALSSDLPMPTLLQTDQSTVATVFQMAENTIRSNMTDAPTDVCARDERLGWGAEGHFALHTAVMLGNAALFLRKWFQDILDGQQEDGCFWAIAPAVRMKDVTPFAGDIQSYHGIYCAWLLARYYRDLQPVRRGFPALEKHFAFCVRNSDRLLRFATSRDWLDLGPNGRSDESHGYGHCDPTLLGTAWFAQSARMMADVAASLGEMNRRAFYQDMYRQIRNAFRAFFVGRDAKLQGATQGGVLAAAAFGLLEDAELDAARDWIERDISARGMTWGTITTPVALHGMDTLGLCAQAAAFIRSNEYPSIGYMAKMGATSVWERWDAIHGNSFHPHPMNAFNHIGFTTIGEWIVSRLAGIQPEEDGFRSVCIHPVFDCATGRISVAYESPHGLIRVAWVSRAEEIQLDVELPVGTHGTFIMDGPAQQLRVLLGAEGMLSQESEDAATVFKLASGSYRLLLSSRQPKQA